MKAWEALEILEGLDPNVEIMLTIGRAKKLKELPQVPKYVSPEFGYSFIPNVPQNPTPPWTTTCSTQYEN